MRNLLTLGCVGLALAAGSSFVRAEKAPKWDELRAKQPAALHLEWILAKDNFFQGEKISATLEFSNADASHPYSLMIGAGAPGAVFFATDESGQAVENPLEWYRRWHGMVIMGPVSTHILGKYSLEIAVNESLRFDKPGVYKVYARSTVTRGSHGAGRQQEELVSVVKTLTILPLHPEKEEELISMAANKISRANTSNAFQSQEGIQELGYLQTPAAREHLIALLASPGLSGMAGRMLLSSANLLAEAERILQTVRDGKLVLDSGGVDAYGELKSSGLVRDVLPESLSGQEMQKRMDELQGLRKMARQEIVAAGIQASGGQGPAYIEALWAAFREVAVYKNPGNPDSDGGKARELMAEHQMELPATHVNELLNAWQYWGSLEFLPLIRREVKPPQDNLVALIALAGLQPEEARPLIIAELKRPDSRFFGGNYPASTLLPSIPPMPLPQSDAVFSKKLAASEGNAFPIIPVVACFGSPALLPKMVEAWKRDGKNPRSGWDDTILRSFFRYWLRHDSEPAAAALKKEIAARGREGWSLLNSVFQGFWLDGGLPAVEWALQSPDFNLTCEAIRLLEEHGKQSSINSVLTALERFRNDKVNAQYLPGQAARLLKNERWHYNAEQKIRLQSLAST